MVVTFLKNILRSSVKSQGVNEKCFSFAILIKEYQLIEKDNVMEQSWLSVKSTQIKRNQCLEKWKNLSYVYTSFVVMYTLFNNKKLVQKWIGKILYYKIIRTLSFRNTFRNKNRYR